MCRTTKVTDGGCCGVAGRPVRTVADVMTVALVDDDVESRRVLTAGLQQYSTNRDVRFDISEYEDGQTLLDGFRSQFDVIIMDVALGADDGFDTAKAVRALDAAVTIVFATNMSQMAIRGYEVGALGYLVKPVSFFALERELDLCVCQKRRRDSAAMLTMSVGANVARVPLNDVTYLESRKHKVVVHALGARYEFVGALKNLQERLEGEGFFLCSPAYLVNMRYVQSLDHDDCMVRGGDHVLVSRRRRHAFMKALAGFVV